MSAGEYCLKQMVSVLNNKRKITNLKVQSTYLINKWRILLGISDWVILCEPISENQVVDDLKGGTSGHEFVGIYIDRKNRIGTIYHTRKLNKNDIIHELLHVRYPQWSEKKVNFFTFLLTKTPLSFIHFKENHLLNIKKLKVNYS